eukprot:NODE_8111_length_723_cov_13.258333_g7859_i0.p1 GENE.NODE_8111_length_723_cov_13.258333_g7859_i0~~NODE_8111_length_723_cov_13.258333_g7859_i0.p1  ORF type:complete len:212 (-),score=30.85 NODE_8111_length_723_cov_13.258333_g7859_i0:88-663(-)
MSTWVLAAVGLLVSVLADNQGGSTLVNETTFLSKNRLDPGVVQLKSGLQYKVLKEGGGIIRNLLGTIPMLDRSSSVDSSLTKVFFRGTLIDGTEFDSSERSGDRPIGFRAGKLIPGWNEAFELMCTGDKWRLFVPPNLAYGSRGGGGIPPNATLIFDVEVVSIHGPYRRCREAMLDRLTRQASDDARNEEL